MAANHESVLWVVYRVHKKLNTEATFVFRTRARAKEYVKAKSEKSMAYQYGGPFRAKWGPE